MTERIEIKNADFSRDYENGIFIFDMNPEQLKAQIISDYEIVERLKERLERLKNIPKNDEDFLFTHYKLEIEDYESILENKK